MLRDSPIWPDFAALDRLWDSPVGHGQELAKAAAMAKLLKKRVEKRPKILIIGPASRAIVAELQALMPAHLIQAYPPKLGARAGACPALLMDTDLPPFARGHFDLVVLNHSLEYRSTPLALLSLSYEVLAVSGTLIALVPHQLGPRAALPGHGTRYVAMELVNLLSQAAFSPRGHILVRGRWGRPQSLAYAARPQHPPHRSGGLPVSVRLRGLWRPQAAPGVALRGKET